MIIKYIYDLAAEKGIELSHVSIHNSSIFSNGNLKSLKISVGGKLVFVPFKSEEHVDGVIGENLRERILNVLSEMPETL